MRVSNQPMLSAPANDLPWMLIVGGCVVAATAVLVLRLVVLPVAVELVGILS